MPLQDEKIYRHERTPLELIGGGVIPFPPIYTPPPSGGQTGGNPPIPQLPYDRPPSPVYRVERYECQECLVTYFEGREVNRKCYEIAGCAKPPCLKDEEIIDYGDDERDRIFNGGIVDKNNFPEICGGGTGVPKGNGEYALFEIYNVGAWKGCGTYNCNSNSYNLLWDSFVAKNDFELKEIVPYDPSDSWSNSYYDTLSNLQGSQGGFFKYRKTKVYENSDGFRFFLPQGSVGFTISQSNFINTGGLSERSMTADWERYEVFIKGIKQPPIEPPSGIPPIIPVTPGDPPMACCDCFTISYIVAVNRLTLFNQIKQELKNTENYLLENLKIDYSIIANMLNQQSLAISEVTLDIVNQYKKTNSESFRVTMDAIVNLQKTLLDINEMQTVMMYENTFYITDFVQSIIENIQIDTTDLVLYLNDLIIEVNNYTTKFITDFIRDVSSIEIEWLRDAFNTIIDGIYDDTDYLVSVSTQTIIDSMTSETDYLYGEIATDIYNYVIPSLNIIRDDIVSFIQYYHLLHLDSEVSLFKNLQAYIKFLFDSLDLGDNQTLIDLINKLRDDIVARFNTLDFNCGEEIDRAIGNLQQNILNELTNVQNNVVNNIQNISVKCPEININPIITILNNLVEITNEIKDSLNVEIEGSTTCEAITDNKNIVWSGLGIVGLNKQIEAVMEYLHCLNTFNTVIFKGEIETRCKEENNRYPYEGKGLTGISNKLEATVKVHQEVLTRVCEMEEKEPQCVSLLPGEIFLERGILKQLVISFGLEYPSQKGTLTHIHIPDPIDNLSWDNFDNWFRPMGNVLGRVQFKGIKQPVGGYALTEEDALALCVKIRSLSKLEAEDHNGQAGRITKGGRVKQPNFTNRTYRAVRAVVTEIGGDGNPVVLKCFVPPKG